MKIELILDESDPPPNLECAEISDLQKKANQVFPTCLENPGPHEKPLPNLAEVSVVIVTDKTIARVHGEFMDDPTPTDVITFHHGEILVSLDTARENAPEFGHSTERELLLYIVHGLLHLNGHHDSDPTERAAMHARQDEILQKIWPFPQAEKSG